MRPLNRRDFLSESAYLTALLAGAGVTSAVSAEEKVAAVKKAPASETLRVALIGAGGRGGDHIKGLAGQLNCLITTVCDVDEAHAGAGAKKVEEQQGKPARVETDLRRILDDKNI